MTAADTGRVDQVDQVDGPPHPLLRDAGELARLAAAIADVRDLVRIDAKTGTASVRFLAAACR
jgi:hypothetical protein